MEKEKPPTKMAWQNGVLTFSTAVELQGHQTISRSEAITSADSHPGWRQTAVSLLTAAKASKSLVVNKYRKASSARDTAGAVSGNSKFCREVEELWPTQRLLFKQSCPLGCLELSVDSCPQALTLHPGLAGLRSLRCRFPLLPC